jgi:hypothetical protein
MSAWIHCHIYNQSSYDLKLVDKPHVGGSGILGFHGNPRWNREPPSAIPATTGSDNPFSAWNDPFLSNIGVGVTYEADVDGFLLRMTFDASANEHPGGGQGQEVKMSKEKIINVHTSASVLRIGEREVHWKLKDWPD